MPDSPVPLDSCTLLVVEDNRTNAAILKMQLLQAGYPSLLLANNGEEALKLTKEHRPDLVILDLMMPEMDGFEYCRQIRSDPSFNTMPIIVQTAMDKEDSILRAFTAGASDYIHKPVQANELIARIKVHLTNKLLTEVLVSERERMETELHKAAVMQHNLMPSPHQIEVAEQMYALDIAQHFETSSIIGGDCWGIHTLTDGRLAIHMFDFSGHGVSSAINVFRMHTLMQQLAIHSNDAGNMLTKLNHYLYPLLQRSEFATMLYAIIDTQANSLEYASAASPPVLLHRAAHPHEWLNVRGFPLGIVGDATYETIYTPFAHGETLLMFSDCLIESKNAQGQVISTDTIARTVEQALQKEGGHKANEVMKHLLDLFRSHSPGPVNDDLTLNVYHRR